MYRKHARVAIGTENMYACDSQRERLQGMLPTYCNHENAEVICYRQVVFNL